MDGADIATGAAADHDHIKAGHRDFLWIEAKVNDLQSTTIVPTMALHLFRYKVASNIATVAKNPVAQIADRQGVRPKA